MAAVKALFVRTQQKEFFLDKTDTRKYDRKRERISYLLFGKPSIRGKYRLKKRGIKINVRLEYFQTERSRTVNIVAGTIRKD